MNQTIPSEKWTTVHSLAVVIILLAMIVIGLAVPTDVALAAWLANLALLAIGLVVAGHGITGFWRGLLIDDRNKFSLSRLQMILWIVVVFSGFFTAVLVNVRAEREDPFEIAIPEEIWLAMGVSTTSLIGSPLLKSTKKDKQPEKVEYKQTVGLLAQQESLTIEEVETKVATKGQIVINTDPKYARLSDLFRGEETGNAASLDLGKMQMFYFSVLLVLGYAVALGDRFSGGAGVAEFPAFSGSMAALMVISHGGYLANKVIPHSGTGS